MNNEKELYDRLKENSLVDSYNKIRAEYGKNGELVSNALLRIAEFIEKSGDPAAIELFRKLDQELIKAPPDKAALRRTWSAIEEILPSISTDYASIKIDLQLSVLKFITYYQITKNVCI